MSRVDKALIYTIGTTAFLVTLGVGVSMSPRSPAVTNQTKLLPLLVRAYPEFASDTSSRIIIVKIGNGLSLVPERDEVVGGYVLTAHSYGRTFSIEAQPVRIGKTGFFSYYRDRTGVIRFETGVKRANADSRPLK